MNKTLHFNKKTREFLDKIKNLSEEDKAYYDKFLNEYYSNALSTDPIKLGNQLHNTKELVSSVYNSTNSRNRDLLAQAKSTNTLNQNLESFKGEDTDKYAEVLKTYGYNKAFTELFEDYSLIMLEQDTYADVHSALKRFYIDLSKLNRLESKFKRQERKNKKEQE